MSHTPAPWSWVHDAEPYSSQWTLSPGVMLVEGTDGTPDGDEIDRANARLIAAAPDLLAALKLVANSGKFSCFFDDAWDVVNDAISKAERRS